MKKLLLLLFIFCNIGCAQWISPESAANPRGRFESNLGKTKKAQARQVRCAPTMDNKIISH